MPKSVNKVILVGNVGKDPEVKYSPSGTPIAKFSLATNEKYKAIPDINGREIFTLVPLGIIVILVGIYPAFVLDLLRASLDNINQIVIPHLGS